MRIAAGILTWRDGPELLAQAIASLAGVADELILCDGVVAGVDRGSLPALTEFDGLHPDTILLRMPFVTQSSKRTRMLGEARRRGCDWLLSLDADERYHEGRVPLRTLLATWDGDAFPLRFLHGFGPTNRDTDPAGEAAAAWKCVRVDAWHSWHAASCYLRHRNGTVYGVMGRIDSAPPGYLPSITHHPEQRPQDRRAIRLGVVEFELEPPPSRAVDLPLPGFQAPGLLQPAKRLFAREGGTMDSISTAEATYYCGQCGARFAGPGTCENGHPAAEVLPLEPAAAAEQGQDKPAETATPPQLAAVTEPEPAAAAPAALLNVDTEAAGQIIAGLRDGLDHLQAVIDGAA